MIPEVFKSPSMIDDWSIMPDKAGALQSRCAGNIRCQWLSREDSKHQTPSDGHVNRAENKTLRRADLRWCFPHARLLVLLISSPPSDPTLSVFFRKALKDTQICRLSESKSRSRHKAVAPERASERATDRERERERVSSTKSRTLEWKTNKQKLPDRRQHTLTHTHTHTYTHTHADITERSLAHSAADGERLSESPGSQLDKRE